MRGDFPRLRRISITCWVAAALPSMTVSAACSASSERVVPDHGTSAGGEVVRIHAAGLAGHGAALVLFDGAPATSVVIEDRGVMKVVTPPSGDNTPSGRASIYIRFADGSAHELLDAFTYDPARVRAKTKEKGR